MKGVTLTPLRQIATLGGSVFHALRRTDEGFAGFGEAYFSHVERNAVKGWKRHRRMLMNLVVPLGRVRFVVHDGDLDAEGTYETYDLGRDAPHYARLTVEPGLWMAFAGVGDETNMVLNVASIPHDPLEADTRELDLKSWRWF